MRIAALYKNPPLIPHGMTEISISPDVMRVKLKEKLNTPALDALRGTERFRALQDKISAIWPHNVNGAAAFDRSLNKW